MADAYDQAFRMDLEDLAVNAFLRGFERLLVQLAEDSRPGAGSFGEALDRLREGMRAIGCSTEAELRRLAEKRCALGRLDEEGNPS